MLKTLFEIQFASVYKSIFMYGANKKQSKLKTSLMALLAIYVIACIVGSFGFIFYQLASAYVSLSLEWVYFANLGILSFGMNVIFSIFISQALLFEAKDNELLLSLPIKPAQILGSRMIVLAAINYFTSALLFFTAGAIYAYLTAPPAMFYVMFIVGLVLLPLLSITFACIFGYIVSFVSSRMRNKSLFITIFSLVLLAVYMWGYITITANTNRLFVEGASIGESIRRTLPPFYYFGTLLCNFDLLSFLMLKIWTIVPFVLVYVLLSKNFIKIVTCKPQAKKIIYKASKMNTESVFLALLKKEMKKFLSSPIYLLNCGIAFLANMALGVYFVWNGSDGFAALFNDIPRISEYIAPVIVAVLCATAAVGCTTAPSISLEGRHIWILKANPIRVSDIFNAKIALNLIFGIATLVFAAICVIYTIRPSIFYSVLLIILPMSVQIFVALEGIVCNLYFPKLDFISEAAVIKQSASMILSILISFAFVAVMVMLYIFLLKDIMTFETIAMVYLLVTILIDAFIYRFIMTKGVKMFNKL